MNMETVLWAFVGLAVGYYGTANYLRRAKVT
jgi:hypothetical protein